MQRLLRHTGALLAACIIVIPGILPAHGLLAQQATMTGSPLEQFLKPDGTLALPTGFFGSVDPAGWRMTVAKDGRPRFVRSAQLQSTAAIADDTADVHWDNRFVGPYGIDGTVNAMVMIGTDVYFGGSFTGTDQITASNIVKWSSVSGTWSPLGDGVDGTVHALAVIGTNLYVGGSFAHAGGAAARNIALWNGTAWSTLGTSPNDGVSSTVDALIASGSNLFVGGAFTTAGSGTTVNRIAKWDGSSWSALGTGMNGNVYALATMGSDLFAGGTFTTAGGTDIRHIARWTGSAWAALGTSPNDGVSSTVYALAASSPFLYVGGSFFTAGNAIPVNYVARWNGSSWAALGNGFTTSTVRTLLVSGSLVYAGGSFSATGITPVNRIAVWDTLAAVWSGLNQGLNSTVYALLQVGNDLYAAGNFTTATNSTTPTAANHVAKWSANSWQGLGNSSSNSVEGYEVYAIAVDGPDLYIGGDFITAASMTVNNIVKYTPATNTWSPLGAGATAGVDDIVNALAIGNSGEVYVGGDFLHAGGSPARSIAIWNGATWSTLGTSPNDGVSAPVSSIVVSGSDVFVGGSFTTAGTVTANGIARWNGSSWSALGTGMNNFVNALAIINSDLYAGGWFTTAGGTTVNYIAKWNGSLWTALGAGSHVGVNSGVYALTVLGNTLFVGGSFDSVAGATIPAGGIATWNGSAWAPLGNGLNGPVYGLTSSGGSIYATGFFLATGILNAAYVARWDTASGGAWNALGSGLNEYGDVITAAGNDVYVGGAFTRAGNRASFRLAHWNPGLVTSVAEQQAEPRGFALMQNYPNPFNPTTAISYQLAANSRVTLKIYDLLGRQVATLVNGFEAAGAHTATFNASALSSGVYFYRMTAGAYTDQKKMLLLK